ncbi:MAG: GHMP kinase [Candidatus Dormibacteraeota bacterium]|nr:GHMP kinase [Candidatus Dormibacteraeota bacterium]
MRLSLAGGGTDLEAYYARYGGAVLSTTIDKYFYVIVSSSDAPHIQVSSSDYHTFFRQGFDDEPIWDGDLRLPRAIIDHFGVHSGINVFLASQVPPGTGLGSSSTVAVALIKAMAQLCRQPMSPGSIADLACHIEIDRLGMPIGRQDQYAAAFGGFNFIEFSADGVAVTPLDLQDDVVVALEQRLMLFFTGRSRDSARILREQKRNSERNRAVAIENLHVIHETAFELRHAFARGDVSALGECLHRTWQAKRRLASGISDPWIDQWYEAARDAGAAGGKITGAGGGGFLLLYCEPECQAAVTTTLEGLGLTAMDFRFETGGAMVIVNTMYAPTRAVQHA